MSQSSADVSQANNEHKNQDTMVKMPKSVYETVSQRLHDEDRLKQDKRTTFLISITVNCRQLFDMCTKEQQDLHHMQRKGPTRNYAPGLKDAKKASRTRRQAQLIKTFLNDKMWRYMEPSNTFVLENKPAKMLIRNRVQILQELKQILSFQTKDSCPKLTIKVTQ